MKRYHDDSSISNNALLWRRIPSWHFYFDKNLDRWRPKSSAFDNHPDGTPMSIILEEIMREYGKGPEDALSGHEDFALASFTAGLARQKKQGVAREPLPKEPAHGVVFGKKTGSVRKNFAKKSVWVIPPANKLE